MRLTDLLTMLRLCVRDRLELRTARARSSGQQRTVVGRVRCPLRGAVQQGAQASFAAISQHARTAASGRSRVGDWRPPSHPLRLQHDLEW